MLATCGVKWEWTRPPDIDRSKKCTRGGQASRKWVVPRFFRTSSSFRDFLVRCNIGGTNGSTFVLTGTLFGLMSRRDVLVVVLHECGVKNTLVPTRNEASLASNEKKEHRRRHHGVSTIEHPVIPQSSHFTSRWETTPRGGRERC